MNKTPANSVKEALKHHKKHGDMDRHICMLSACALHYPKEEHMKELKELIFSMNFPSRTGFSETSFLEERWRNRGKCAICGESKSPVNKAWRDGTLGKYYKIKKITFWFCMDCWNAMPEDMFRVDIHRIWTCMHNEDKFITITVHNDARESRGSMTIGLTEPWLDRDYQKDGSYEKVLWLDTEEKFIKFFDALMKIEGCSIND